MKTCLVFLLAACATTPAEIRAGERRVEAWRLSVCIEDSRCLRTRECLQESAARCLAKGLERTCGSDELSVARSIRCGGNLIPVEPKEQPLPAEGTP